MASSCGLVLVLALALTATSAMASEYDWALSGTDWPDVCATGMRQSPINIAKGLTCQGGALANFSVNYGVWPTYSVINTGKVIQVKAVGSSSSIANMLDGQYSLLQFHFHAFSEHARNGMYSAAECHFVHSKVDDPTALAVIGVELRIHPQDKDNAWLNKFLGVVPTAKGDVNVTAPFRPSDLFLRSGSKNDISFYTYAGSLTTPPCTETVTWHYLNRPQYISVKQSIALMNIVSGVMHGMRTNNRPPQPLNGRGIKYYTASQ